ncbi:MAG: hypothetical protein IPG88_12625 [Gemmatimonadetes bacterium]|nr:hypothetical protein [Gemmatimonadota bacterium]
MPVAAAGAGQGAAAPAGGELPSRLPPGAAAIPRRERPGQSLALKKGLT